MKVHFVYAGDQNNTLNIAPYTITRHTYHALCELGKEAGFDVAYYDWCCGGPFQPVGPDDIIIGHPNYPDSTAIRQLFKNTCRAKILMFPFHHAIPHINWPFDDLVKQANAHLCITGPYWFDTVGKSQFASWAPNMIRLDMAIDHERFPVVKKTFNPPGQRGFFYIGADRPEKGLSTLYEIFKGTSHKLYLYGPIDGASRICSLPNVHLRGWAGMEPQFARDLASIADCHVHGGVSDANPTTLLESTCFGFVAACTPQSGYWPDKPFYGLNADDIAGCRGLLDYIQTVPGDVLRMRAESNRLHVVSKHTWAIFTKTVTDVVRRFL